MAEKKIASDLKLDISDVKLDISDVKLNPTNSRQSLSLESKSSIIGGPFPFGSFINNGSFENSFNNWRTIGDTSIETKAIGIAPTNGKSQALMTTGFRNSGGSVEESDLSDFLDLPSGSLDGLLGGNATEGSGMKQTFTAKAGDILEFDYTFLTNEATPTKTFNDSAFFTLGGFTLELADTFDPTFSNKSVKGFSEATDTQTLKIAISKGGTYELGFGVTDLTDTIVDSGLLIDDVKLNSTGFSFASDSPVLKATATDDAAAAVDFTFTGDGFKAAASVER